MTASCYVLRNARSFAASKFNEEVKTSGGIRFLAKLEQCFQIFKAGLKTKIIDEIIPFCLVTKCSEASSQSLFDAFRK